MSDSIGPLTVGRRHANPFLGRDMMEDRNYSDEIAHAIDKEIRATMDAAYERAKAILIANREKMDTVVKVLLEKETLERQEFEALMRGEAPMPAKAESAPTQTPPKQAAKAEPDEVIERAPESKPMPEPGVA